MPPRGRKKLAPVKNNVNEYIKPLQHEKINIKMEPQVIVVDEYSDPPSIDEDSSSEDERSTFINEFLTTVDRHHIGDLSFVPNYAEQIIINLQKQEISTRIPIQNFSEIQKEVTLRMRTIVIRWLINVHHEYDLTSETLFTSIYYFDYVLSQIFIRKQKIQLLGSVCLWIAAKIHEISPPSVNVLIELCSTQYELSDFEEYERLVLNVLHFRLHIPHTKFFLRRYIDALELRPSVIEAANFICESSLFSYELNQYNPSTVAAAIIIIAITLMKNFLPLKKLKYYAHLQNYIEVEECIACLVFCSREVLDSKKGAIYQKYTDSSSEGALLHAEFNDELINRIINLGLSRE